MEQKYRGEWAGREEDGGRASSVTLDTSFSCASDMRSPSEFSVMAPSSPSITQLRVRILLALPFRHRPPLVRSPTLRRGIEKPSVSTLIGLGPGGRGGRGSSGGGVGAGFRDETDRSDAGRDEEAEGEEEWYGDVA